MAEAEIARIEAEYARRTRELPADRYSWSHPANLFMHQGVVRECIKQLSAAGCYPLDGRSVLDVGCGSGSWLLEFMQWGADPAQLAGIDLLESRVASARRRIPSADLRTGSAAQLPWPTATFDVVSQFTLFTSILSPELKRSIASEMMRVLRPGGVILWYDFRLDNPANDQVKGIEEREIRSLFPGCTMRIVKTTLAPPLARRLAPLSWPLALQLERLPFLRTHYVGLFQTMPGVVRAEPNRQA